MGEYPSSPAIREPRELSHDWLKTWSYQFYEGGAMKEVREEKIKAVKVIEQEIKEKVEQNSNKMDTYKEYITKIIIKEIQNMELEKVLDYTNMVVKLNKKTSQNDNISIKIPLKTKVDDMTEIEINIKNTYKIYQNINAR